ncbi:glycoside hydrolase family 27 protein [Plicaturopsis crispa FD-325 SS-3]|nr:glycoside hydrolase family 27 protein [Plicaturopsis crispa FD-325 SS-3]
MLTAYTLVLLFSTVYAQAGEYAQCGGTGWSGATTCVAGWTCVQSNEYYSQCLPSATSLPSAPSATSAPSASSATTTSTTSLTGLAGSAPTAGPSLATGKTPALGWNGWNAYGCAISEAKVLAAANSIVSLGLKDAGYEYVNIDDCWALMSRNSSTQQIVPDPAKFPNGISAVADQVHALGLKLGIYGDAGSTTCAGFPGSLGYESIDASTFSSWGLDYLKYDNCAVPGNWSDSSTPPDGDWYNSNSAIRYRQMAGALAAQPQTRPIQFDLCIWGTANVWTWGARVGHSWRMSGDSSASWSYITSILTTNAQYLSYVDFYAHNDMDMMEIGNGNFTAEEERTHFAAWVFMKSPILLGTDLSLLSTDQVAIISNPELLAFHQDTTVGASAVPFNATSSMPTTSPPEYYAGASSKGVHVFIINISASNATKTFDFASVPGLNSSGSYKLHDMWTGTDVAGTFAGSSSYAVSVAAHDTVAYLITPA